MTDDKRPLREVLRDLRRALGRAQHVLDQVSAAAREEGRDELTYQEWEQLEDVIGRPEDDEGAHGR